MGSIEEKIKEIEEEIRSTPYNKATSHHIGKLRAKLARLRDEAQKRSTKAGGRTTGIRKAGDATVVLVGFPSVGKSTLLNCLTEAKAEVGGYDFTTIEVIPGMMRHKGARIQLLDVPGLISGAAEGRGRGRKVLSVVRSADLILTMTDINGLDHLPEIERELYRAGIRPDESPPAVTIEKRSKGGIEVSSTLKLTKVDEDLVKAVLEEHRIHNAAVIIREDLSLERLIDAVSRNRRYIPSLLLINKIDMGRKALEKIDRPFVGISAKTGENIAELKDRIFERLGLMRVYLQPKGGEPDLDEPMIVRKGATVADVCNHLHKDFRESFKHARVWGRSAKFEGQEVGLGHVLQDGDIVSIVTS